MGFIPANQVTDNFIPGGQVSDYEKRIRQDVNCQQKEANRVGGGTTGQIGTAGSRIADFEVNFIQTDATGIAQKRGSIQLGDLGSSRCYMPGWAELAAHAAGLEAKHQGKAVDHALRANTGKLRYSMVDPLFLTELTKVLEFGAQKYDRDNWKKGLKYQSVVDSIERHLIAFRSGEDFDTESGLLHLAHVACNVMFLTHYFIKGDKSLDDR